MNRQRCVYAIMGVVLLFFGTCFFWADTVCAEIYEADTIPWSGYWWPARSGGLATGKGYNGHPAPLEKYELLTAGESGGPLVHWYLDYYYTPPERTGGDFVLSGLAHPCSSPTIFFRRLKIISFFGWVIKKAC